MVYDKPFRFLFAIKQFVYELKFRHYIDSCNIYMVLLNYNKERRFAYIWQTKTSIILQDSSRIPILLKTLRNGRTQHLLMTHSLLRTNRQISRQHSSLISSREVISSQITSSLIISNPIISSIIRLLISSFIRLISLLRSKRQA